MALRKDWAWQPDSNTVEAIKRGNAKIRAKHSRKETKQLKESMTMAKKTKSKNKGPKGKKLDGKKLAAQRKPRDSVAQFIKDQLLDGKSDVEKIVEAARKAYPKTTPTNGYVRWLAKKIGKEKQVAVVTKTKSKSDDVAS